MNDQHSHLEKPHTDPVCGMRVAANPDKSVEHQGTTYYFCCQGCVSKFKAAPNQYIHAEELQPNCCSNVSAHATSAAQMKPAEETQWTCPMHPEVRQTGPGTCPKCGMALEPMQVSLQETANPELEQMTLRFWICALLSAPLLFMSMGDMIPGLNVHHVMGARVFAWLQAALATPVVLWGGSPFFERAWQSVVNKSLNMFTLIGLGTAAAYLFSLVALLFPGALPESFKIHGEAPLYFEASAVIITLVLLGQVLELRARSNTNNAIKSLLQLAPNTAIKVDAQGNENEVALDAVQAGDHLRVKPGGKIPVDGVVIDGSSYVDESMITGESMPVAKQINSHVTAGTLNQTGSFVLRAEKVGADTLLSHIVQMVSDAGRSRAPIQKLADQVSAWFVPAVIAVSIIAFITWLFIGSEQALSHAVVVAVSVLIIACPCALGLATPIAMMVGMGRGAHEGVLIKDAEALEQLEKIDTLVVDKTGTLTEGKPKVQAVKTIDGFDKNTLIEYAVALEQRSEHPLARAIVNYATPSPIEGEGANQKDVQRLNLPQVANFTSITGKGVQGVIEDNEVMIGNQALMKEKGIELNSLESQVESLREAGQTVMYVSVAGKLAGLISVTDTIKPTTNEAVSLLQSSGLRIVLLTGDKSATANVVAKQLHIDEVHAEVRPDEKFKVVQSLQQQGRKVAMAGDGINDAPALAAANVGIAMGNGTDIAMNSAQVVLVKGDLRGIAKAIMLSRGTMKNIRQNLFFAFAYNFIGVPIAAGVLYPFFGILLSPMIASAAMSLSSVSVISNALRLRRLVL